MAASISPGSIKRVCVVGAGTMGAGIAAQVANAGVPVVLLDIVPPGASNRNALAEGAVAKMRKAEPAADDPAVPEQLLHLVGMRRRADVEVFGPAPQ